MSFNYVPERGIGEVLSTTRTEGLQAVGEAEGDLSQAAGTVFSLSLYGNGVFNGQRGGFSLRKRPLSAAELGAGTQTARESASSGWDIRSVTVASGREANAGEYGDSFGATFRASALAACRGKRCALFDKASGAVVRIGNVEDRGSPRVGDCAIGGWRSQSLDGPVRAPSAPLGRAALSATGTYRARPVSYVFLNRFGGVEITTATPVYSPVPPEDPEAFPWWYDTNEFVWKQFSGTAFEWRPSGYILGMSFVLAGGSTLATRKLWVRAEPETFAAPSADTTLALTKRDADRRVYPALPYHVTSYRGGTVEGRVPPLDTLLGGRGVGFLGGIESFRGAVPLGLANLHRWRNTGQRNTNPFPLYQYVLPGVGLTTLETSTGGSDHNYSTDASGDVWNTRRLLVDKDGKVIPAALLYVRDYQDIAIDPRDPVPVPAQYVLAVKAAGANPLGASVALTVGGRTANLTPTTTRVNRLNGNATNVTEYRGAHDSLGAGAGATEITLEATDSGVEFYFVDVSATKFFIYLGGDGRLRVTDRRPDLDGRTGGLVDPWTGYKCVAVVTRDRTGNVATVTNWGGSAGTDLVSAAQTLGRA